MRGVLELSKLKVHVPDLDADALAQRMVAALLVGWGADAGSLAAASTGPRAHKVRKEQR